MTETYSNSIACHPRSSRTVLASVICCGVMLLVAASFVVPVPNLLWIGPSCGGCDELAETGIDRIPGVGLRWSVLGLAYALLLTWDDVRPPKRYQVPVWIRALAVSTSLILTLQLVWFGPMCGRCLMFHTAHWLHAWMHIARLHRPIGGGQSATDRISVSFVTAGRLATLLLLVQVGVWSVAHWQTRSAERQHAAALARLTRTNGGQAMTSAIEDVNKPAATLQRATDRYRLGPANASIQITGFIDYDCILCRDICRQIDAVMQVDRSVAFTPRHYPLCRPCNQRPGLSACRKWSSCDKAALAEGAGQLGGTDAFFKAHRALIAGAPQPSSEWLAAELNVSADQLRAAVASDSVRERIAADIAEADRRGLLSTPMVFVNAIEIRATALPGVIRETVAAIRSAKEIRTAAETNALPLVVEKMIADWRLARLEPMSSDGVAWPIGRSGDAALVLWADPLAERTVSLDRQLRALTVRHPHAVYRFRPLPSGNASENAARLIEAAEQRAGPTGFWALQRWILENRRTFSPTAVEALLDRLGLAAESFRSEADSPEVTARLDQSRSEAAARDGWVLGPPMLYVAGRWLPIAPTTGNEQVAEAVDYILAHNKQKK